VAIWHQNFNIWNLIANIGQHFWSADIQIHTHKYGPIKPFTYYTTPIAIWRTNTQLRSIL